MKLAIGTIPLDMVETNVVEVEVRAPANVIGHHISYRAPRLVVRRGHERDIPVMNLIVEFTTTGEYIKKRFVGVRQGQVLDTDALGDGELFHVATFVNPNDGKPVAIYEHRPSVIEGAAP